MSGAVNKKLRYKAEIQDIQFDVHNYPQVIHNVYQIHCWEKSSPFKQNKHGAMLTYTIDNDK